MMSTTPQRGSTITSSKTRDLKDEPNAAARANYSVREETPMFVFVFAVPAIAALLVLWRS
jgi:hypothetical protein